MWKYNNKELKNEHIPNKAVGFIYIIINKTNNKKYVGKKLLTKAAYKTVNKVKKKIRKESDWQDYYSSSDILLSDVEKFGKENFERIILHFCINKTELNFLEEELQHKLNVLRDENWYNSNIRSRYFKSRIYKKVIDLQDIIDLYK